MLLKIFLIFFAVDCIACKCLLNFQPAKVCKFFQLTGKCNPDIIDQMENICDVSKITRNEKKCPVYNCFTETAKQISLLPTEQTSTYPITTFTTPNTATITLTHTLTTTLLSTLKTTTETTTTILSSPFTTSSDFYSFEQNQEEAFISEPIAVNEKKRNQDETLETPLVEQLQQTETYFQKEVSSSELLDFIRMSSGEFDCGEKTCFLEYHFQKVCSIVVNNGSKSCNVPCDLTSCNYELHKNINCPLWTCVPLPAPITTSVPPVTTTTSPDQSNQNEIIMITSLIINAILILLISVIVFYKVKSYRRRRHYNDPEQEFLENENIQPIIRSRSQRLPDSFGMINFEVSLNEPTPNLEENSSAILTLNSPETSHAEASSTFKKFEKFEEKKNKHRNKIV